VVLDPDVGRVRDILTCSCISAVNLAETYGKLVEYGKPVDAIAHEAERLQMIPVIAFDVEQAHIGASLWKKTRAVGLSLGDRACISWQKNHAACVYDERRLVKMQPGS
jgi:ribonuclease VapC